MVFRRALATLSLAAIVCLAATPARAQDVINKEGAALVKASFIGDLDNVLSDPRVDAVVIATPVFTHYDLATRALQYLGLAGRKDF